MPEGERRRGRPRGNGQLSQQNTIAETAQTRLGATGWELVADRLMHRGGILPEVLAARRSRGVARRRGLDCLRKMAVTGVGPELRRTELGCHHRQAVKVVSRRGCAAGSKDHEIHKGPAEAGHRMVVRKESELGEAGCKGLGRDIRHSAEGREPSRNLDFWSACVRMHLEEGSLKV